MPEEKDPVAFLCESSKTEALTRDLAGWTSKLFADDPRLNDTFLVMEDYFDFEISAAGAQAILAS